MSIASDEETMFTWMMEHDVRLRVLAAAVASDADITATLVAHCVWCRIAHEPADLETILVNDIQPATIFAGGPVTTLLFNNSRLWTVVRTALITLYRLPTDISQVFALNSRLADAVVAHQRAARPAKLPRFIIPPMPATLSLLETPHITLPLPYSSFSVDLTRNRPRTATRTTLVRAIARTTPPPTDVSATVTPAVDDAPQPAISATVAPVVDATGAPCRSARRPT